MEQYPVINFLLRYGDAFAAAVALLPVSAGVVATVFGLHWVLIVAGAITSVVLGVLMKSYIELVRVVADMLIPK